MNDLILNSRLQLLTSEHLQKELLLFVEQLLQKQFSTKPTAKRIPRFGCAKGTFQMSDDFDAPLDDFKDYTQ
ncbi:MAG: DUF2281 domain-containing protein [Thermoflexibacteraceae bacterium]|jgi:hypothetical protein